MATSDDTPQTKTCTKCGETKLITAFAHQKSLKDGYKTHCKTCTSTTNTQWRQQNKRHLDDYAHRPEIQARRRRQSRQRYANLPQAHKQLLYLDRKNWREAHPGYSSVQKSRRKEHYQLLGQLWRQKNKAHKLAYERAWRARHQTWVARKNKRYRMMYPEKAQFYSSRKKAMRRNVAINDLTVQDWLDILAAFASCCAYCGQYRTRLTQDHVTPIARGGNHTKSNIVPACVSCNSKKALGPPLIPVQPLLL